jgi:hypothetical protein
VGKDGFKELGWPFVIGIGKSSPLHTIDSQMVKLGPIEFEMLNNITQAGSAGDLSKRHDHKLAPTLQGAILALGSKAVLYHERLDLGLFHFLNRTAVKYTLIALIK